MSDMENFKGTWNFVNEKKGEDKRGKITSRWTKEGEYELKGVENYDGICKATVPKDITLTGFYGNGEKINYVTVGGGKSDTFKGNVNATHIVCRCFRKRLLRFH